MVVVPRESVAGRHKPIATISIIIVNTVVFLYTAVLNGNLLQSSIESIYEYGLRPSSLFIDPNRWLLTLFTSMFMHADILHILFNMYFLWIFGSRVEGFLGSPRFLVLYFTSGISAVLYHIAFTPLGGLDSLVIPAVGASGAISGVLGAYLLMLPYTKLTVCMFFFLIPLCFTWPASAFLIFWFAQQVIYGYLRLGGVAYFAHVGGFVMGILLAPYLVRRQYYSTESHMDYLFRYLYDYLGIIVERPRSLGRGSRLLLVVLFSVIAIGFIYGAFISHRLFTDTKSLYISSLEVAPDGYVQSDQFIVQIGDTGVLVQPRLISQLDYVRITGNRLISIIHNRTQSGEFYFTKASYTVIINNVEVPVVLSNTRIIYDERGVAIYIEGTMETRSVLITQYGGRLGDYLRLRFKYQSTSPDLTLITGLSGLSALVSLLAIISVLRADEALVYQRLRIPDLYPFI